MNSDSIPAQVPGSVLLSELERRGWNQYDLAEVLKVPQSVISSIMNGKRVISVDLDHDLSAALGTPVGFWVKLATEYSLFSSQAQSDGIAQREIERRAQLYQKFPIREMQRRGWIKAIKDTEGLEEEVSKFFGPSLCVATRRSKGSSEALNPIQEAWCHRARQIAQTLLVKLFDRAKLDQAEQKLRILAAYPKEARHLPKVLAEYGIRFVVVEPIAGAKIDGAAFWLDDDSPVIAVSGRFDRIDAFWFTVMHEFSHIRHEDSLSVDSELVGESDKTTILVKDEVEMRADKEAAAALIPSEEMDSFIRRLGPLYSKERIVQFAHRIKIHPGIIVGQLQYRGEIGYSAHREMLAKVRSTIIETALTDGWGRTLSPEFI